MGRWRLAWRRVALVCVQTWAVLGYAVSKPVFILTLPTPLALQIRVQEALMEIPWSDALLRLDGCRALYVKDKDLGPIRIQGGLAMKMGMAMGLPRGIRPHGATGLASYYGPVCNRAARIASLASSGQILVRGAPQRGVTWA